MLVYILPVLVAADRDISGFFHAIVSTALLANTTGLLLVFTAFKALNHCPTTRAQLRQALAQAGLGLKVAIPADGDVVDV